jgi:hypothetical protein
MDSQNEKNINTIENKSAHDLACSFIIKKIEKTLNNTPAGENKKEYLLKTLSDYYNVAMAERVMSVLPEEYFLDEPDEEEEKEEAIEPEIINQNPDADKKDEVETNTTENIDPRIKKLNEQDEEIKRKKIQKILQEKRDKETKKEKKAREKLEKKQAKEIVKQNKKKEKEENPKPEKIKKEINWKKYFNMGKYFVPAVVVAGMALAKPFEKKESGNNNKEKEKTSVNTERRVMGPEEMAEIPNPRFNNETYEALPDEMKQIYKRHAENDPTPGSAYQVYYKKTQELYVFDSENTFINKVVGGSGKDAGDAPNTSVEFDKGQMTTPSGVYLISRSRIPGDEKNYGELQFSLFGVTVLGERTTLGEHQTYSGHGELGPRLRKLGTPSPLDNMFSNGCINITAEDFAEYIAQYFKGDCSELLYILQDDESIKSGAKFDVNALIGKIMPAMIAWAEKEKQVYSESIPVIKAKINKLENDTIKLHSQETQEIRCLIHNAHSGKILSF